MKKFKGALGVLLSGILLSACSEKPVTQESNQLSHRTSTTSLPRTTLTPVDYELESCASTIAGWRDWLSPRFLTGGYDNLYALRNSGLLWGTDGIGGEIGEWLRENGASYAIQSVGGSSSSSSYPLSQVSPISECSNLRAKGYDISQLPLPPY